MAGKVSHISNKPTGAISLYNPDNDEWYVATCDANGVMQIQGLVSGQIAIETGHGKTLEDPAYGTISTATTTAAIAAGGSGIKTYIYGIRITGLSATKQTLTVKSGSTVLDSVDIQSTGDDLRGFVDVQVTNSWIYQTAANEAFNITSSAAVVVKYKLNYWQE